MEHIQLTTFQTMSSTEFDQTVLNSVIQEINQIIKDNMMEFRLTFELIADSLEAKLYKNAITGYYINKGFKIVNYLGFIYIDWSHPNVHINTPASPLYNVLMMDDIYDKEVEKEKSGLEYCDFTQKINGINVYNYNKQI